MSSRTVIALLAGVAVAAAGISTDALAFGHGGGGGGGFHGGGGGFHGGFVGIHGGGFHGGGFHGLAGHGFAGHGFAGHGFAGHVGHGFAGHRLAGHVGRGFAGHGFAGNRVGAVDRFAGRRDFAHGRFAARDFHGLYDLNRAGFNRNAFGNGRGWNRWGNRLWGAGWGGGWGGWAGPVFWPFLYGDVFSYAFWPYGYDDPFWALGPDFVFASIFGPDYGYGPDYGNSGTPNVYYGTTRARRRAAAQMNEAAVESCNGLAPGVTDLPIAQIRKDVRPTGDQVAALDDLREASIKASDNIKASCPTAIPLTPVARLDVAEQRLDAMINAVQVVRDPLEKFYDTLSDEQKQQLNAIGKADASRGQPEGAPVGGDVAALCGHQPGDVARLPVQRIEQVVHPNAQRRDAFDGLKTASENTAEQLQTSCPAQMPQTPVARLDAVKTRLSAMVDAMKTVRPKLAAFYDSLSDEQKAKFNTMGPPRTASTPPRDQLGNQ